MHFLTVTHFFEGHGGGIERVAGHLCRNLAAAGRRAEWAASAADPAPVDGAIAALPIKCFNPTERLTGLPMPIPGPRGFAALARAVDRADAVIIHDALYVTSIAALVLARMKRKPVVLIQHIASIEFSSPVMRAVMRLANFVVTRPMLRSASQVVFISATVRAAFADLQFREPPQLVFNGVDTATFKPESSISTGAARDHFNLPSSGKLIAFAGRFVEKKGLAVLQAVCREHPDINFALAGSGPINPAAWKLPNVHLLGNLSPQELAQLYRASDYLLLPSVGEGYPLVIQEALACGLPVICGDESARADPAATRWLRGVAIDLADPETTARAVAAQILCDAPSPETKAEMAHYAAKAYSWPAMAQSIAGFASTLSGAR